MVKIVRNIFTAHQTRLGMLVTNQSRLSLKLLPPP